MRNPQAIRAPARGSPTVIITTTLDDVTTGPVDITTAGSTAGNVFEQGGIIAGGSFPPTQTGHGTGYGHAQRGAVSIHLSEWDEHDPKRTGAVIYLYVSDADAVRAEWASCGAEGRLGEIRNTDYGMREFGFVDTDGTLHRVGSKLP